MTYLYIVRVGFMAKVWSETCVSIPADRTMGVGAKWTIIDDDDETQGVTEDEEGQNGLWKIPVNNIYNTTRCLRKAADKET